MFHVFPAIDIRDGKCVRLQQGDYNRQTVYDARPVDMAKAWQDAGAPLIHLVDLDGAKDGRPCNTEVIQAICKSVSIPCELGGGIRTKADILGAIRRGVKRIVLGTVVVETPEIVSDLLDELTSDEIVAGLDARDGKVAVRGWRETSAIDALELARRLVDLGVTRIIYTDIRTDGMFTGPNLSAIAALCDALPTTSIIASGGVGEPAHVAALAGLKRANLEGVIVGKALYDGRVTYAELVAATAG